MTQSASTPASPCGSSPKPLEVERAVRFELQLAFERFLDRAHKFRLSAAKKPKTWLGPTRLEHLKIWVGDERRAFLPARGVAQR